MDIHENNLILKEFERLIYASDHILIIGDETTHVQSQDGMKTFPFVGWKSIGTTWFVYEIG